MTTNELQHICEIWTEYLQCSTDNQNVRYFVREDGQLMYEDEDEDFFESKEQALVNDINDTFRDFFRDKSLQWLRCEYCEEVLGLNYQSHQRKYNEVCELLRQLDGPKQEEFIIRKLEEVFGQVDHKADYMLNTLK